MYACTKISTGQSGQFLKDSWIGNRHLTLCGLIVADLGGLGGLAKIT